MKAQRRLGLELSWPRITWAFLIDIAVLTLATRLPVSASPTVVWWVGVAVAAVVTIAALLTYRGITIASALARWVRDWSADIWESSTDSVATLSPGCKPAIDHRCRVGRDVVGVREYAGHLVAVIAVDEKADPPSARHQRGMVPPCTLPVAAVAAGLRQFDVRLDAIDIVSVRMRHLSGASDNAAPPSVERSRREYRVRYMDCARDGSAAERRGGGGPRFGGLGLGGGRRAARGRSGWTALRGQAFDRR
jgi:type VII secretion protein EccE